MRAPLCRFDSLRGRCCIKAFYKSGMAKRIVNIFKPFEIHKKNESDVNLNEYLLRE